MRGTAFRNEMRVVVAGGAGFLGSHLCAKLVRRGCSVLAIDDLSTERTDGRPRGGPDASLARSALGWSPRVSLDVGLARTIDWFDGILSRARSPHWQADHALA